MKAKILLFFLFTSAILHSQEVLNNDFFSISGEISDTVENKALAYINITLLSAKDSSFIKSGITNEKGKFIFENLKPDRYLLRIISVNYKPLYRLINLNNDISLKIYLKNNDTELDEVTVAANKEIYTLEPDKRVYLTANDESIQNASASDAIENAPGVYTDINDNIKVRGQNAEVRINGEEIKKTPESLQNYLEMLPASQIKKIEVITNPSAEFSASDKNIIVNIVLKEKISQNNLFAVGLIYSTMPRYAVWTTYFKTTKKYDLNFYGRFFSKTLEYGYIQKSHIFNNNDTVFYSKNESNWHNDAFMVKPYLDFTYRINKKNIISVTTLYQYYHKKNVNSTININKYDNSDNYYSDLSGIFYNSGIYTAVNFKHKFPKKNHKFSFFISYTNMHDFFNSNINESYSDFKFYNYKIIKEKTVYVYAKLKGNYSYTINKNIKIKTGFFINPFKNTYYENITDTSSSSYPNPEYCSFLSQKYYEEKPVFEYYTTLSGKISALNYKLGLRYERQLYRLNQTIPAPDFIFNKKYTDFYPSVHISYTTKTKHNFSLSYTKRTDIPLYFLNPYIDRSNINYVSAGNPYLEYAKTNSYDFTYFKNLKNANITFSLYRYDTRNDINDVYTTYFDDYLNKSVVLQTYENNSKTKFSGSEFSLFGNIYKKIKIRINTDLYYKQIEGNYDNNYFNKSYFVYTNRLSFSYKLLNRDIQEIQNIIENQLKFFG